MSCSDTVVLPGFLPSLVMSLLQHLLKLLAGAPETGPSSPWENPVPFSLPISRANSVLKTVVLSHLGWWEAGLLLLYPPLGLSSLSPVAESSLPPTDMAPWAF